MKKASRYLLALAVCVGIFILWVIFQMYVGKGVLVGVLFCGAMFGAWKAIVNGGEQTEEGEQNTEPSDSEAKPDEENKTDEQ